MFHFEWDPRKALSNWWKHRVTFEEAVAALVVVHTDDGETIRIISARQATARERKDYEDGQTR